MWEGEGGRRGKEMACEGRDGGGERKKREDEGEGFARGREEEKGYG